MHLSNFIERKLSTQIVGRVKVARYYMIQASGWDGIH